MNSLLLILKFGIGNDPFPLQKYSEIKGYEGNVEDLKLGKFESEFALINRYEDKQVEIYRNGDSSVFNIEWISNNEYRLIHQGDNPGMNDTLEVKITDNTKEYYDCYLRYGEYADFEKIKKK